VRPIHLLDDVPPGPAVRAWIERIRAEPIAGSAMREVGACEIEASGPFGRVSVQAREAKGHPNAPLTAEELEEKFCANVALAGIGNAEAHELAAAVVAVDRSPDLMPLMRALRRPQARTPLARH
jgi:hypothetical protein